MLNRFNCLNDPVNKIDQYGLNPAAIQYVIDFGYGFFDPGPPPPTPGGATGWAARQFINEIVDLDDLSSFMWEAYYKEHLNRNWRNDPTSPYYEGLTKLDPFPQSILDSLLEPIPEPNPC